MKPNPIKRPLCNTACLIELIGPLGKYVENFSYTIIPIYLRASYACGGDCLVNVSPNR